MALGLGLTVESKEGVPWRSEARPNIPGEGQGDFVSASGRGATGCTGLVCLAASFFRLACLRWNISSMLSCFWKTFCTCFWSDRVWRTSEQDPLQVSASTKQNHHLWARTQHDLRIQCSWYSAHHQCSNPALALLAVGEEGWESHCGMRDAKLEGGTCSPLHASKGHLWKEQYPCGLPQGTGQGQLAESEEESYFSIILREACRKQGPWKWLLRQEHIPHWEGSCQW